MTGREVRQLIERIARLEGELAAKDGEIERLKGEMAAATGLGMYKDAKGLWHNSWQQQVQRVEAQLAQAQLEIEQLREWAREGQ